MNRLNLKISYEHTWIDHPLHIKWFVDQQIIKYDVSGNSSIHFEKNVSLDNGVHTLGFEILNKNNDNVTMDTKGQILKDTLIKIEDIKFDDISVIELFINEKGFYKFSSKNPNNTVANSAHFGYNGTTEISFKMPIYEWLLEILY